jgi:hypothetical protein
MNRIRIVIDISYIYTLYIYYLYKIYLRAVSFPVQRDASVSREFQELRSKLQRQRIMVRQILSLFTGCKDR